MKIAIVALLAALALSGCETPSGSRVGWYLMLPPTVFLKNDSFEVEQQAPISAWKVWSSFDVARECTKTVASMGDWAARAGNSTAKQQWAVAVCIATDDPRLKD